MKVAGNTAALGDIVDLIMGQAPSSKDTNFEGQGTPFVKVGEFGELRPVIHEWTTNPLRMARKTDVLLCVVGATCGKINLGEECAIGRSVAAIRPHPSKLDQFYLYYFMMTLVERLRSGSVGAAQTVISKEMVQKVQIPFPPLSEQQRIVGVLDEAFASLATAQAHAAQNLQNARALFESHLNAVFTQQCEGWVETTIGDCIRFIDYRGKTPTKTPIGLRLITAKNVKMGFLQREPEEFVAPESYNGWMTRGIPRVGDVLFTTEAPLANIAQLDTSDKVVFAQRIIIMQSDAAKLDSTFLKYLLLSNPVQDRIHAKGTGATVKGIKASLLKTIEVSFPKTIQKQQHIVSQLDALAAETQRLAQIYEQKLAALVALKKSLLYHAFNGEL
jgi:type I restriction enzyme S subunit